MHVSVNILLLFLSSCTHNVYRLQQLLFIYCLYVCVVVYAAFQANKVVYISN